MDCLDVAGIRMFGSSLGISLFLDQDGMPWGLNGEESACQRRRRGFDPWAEKTPWRREWKSTPVFMPGRAQGQRSLVGTVHGVAKEADTTS